MPAGPTPGLKAIVDTPDNEFGRVSATEY